MNAVVNAVEKENSIRIHYSSGEDVLFSLKDLQLGAKGELKELIPGQRFQLILGEEGNSLYCYKAVLLDAKAQSEPFTYDCAIFIVPKVDTLKLKKYFMYAPIVFFFSTQSTHT